MKMTSVLWLLAGMLATTGAFVSGAAAAEPPEKVLADFQDQADLEKFGVGDSGSTTRSIAPRAVTDSNLMMKVVFGEGAYPGFAYRDVPRDWSSYEVLRFVVWTDSPYSVSIRIDDGKSVDYRSRYNKTFRLAAGRNLCQIPVSDIARVLNVQDIRALILFAASPPAGLTMWFDDFVLGPAVAEEVPFIPYDQRRDLQPTLEVVTPHLPFGKNLAGGPLRAFAITGVRLGREVSELMQRVDLDVRVLTWDRAWDINTWGMGDFYGQRGHAFDRDLMQRYLASSMLGPETFEVMILTTPIGWNQFPEAARKAIISRVKDDGEGLLLVQPFPGEQEWPEDLREISALVDCVSPTIDPNVGYVRQPAEGQVSGQAWKAAGEHPIIAGLPLEALPFERMSYLRYKLAPGAKAILVSESGDPILAERQVGKGRVVTAAWEGGQITPSIQRGQGEGKVRPYRYWEVLYSLLGRSAMYAAGREMSRSGSGAALEATGENAEANLAVRQWKDAAGRVTDWEMSFVAPGADGVQQLAVEAPGSVRRGEPIEVTFAAEAGAAPYTVLLGETAEGRWRTLERTAAARTDEGTWQAELPTARLRQALGVVRVEGLADGKVVARGQAEVVVTPAGPTWDDYEVFMWPVDGLPFLREIEDVLIRVSGSSGVMETGWSNPDKLMRWSRAGLRILPHDLDVRPLHIRPHEMAEISRQWRQTQDKKHLIRPHSYADPEFLAETHERMTRAAQLLAPFHIPAYVLADEPSLTSYREDFDFDFHPANIEAFREAMAAKFGSIEALNSALGTNQTDFETLEPPTTDEAREAGNWGLWNEWRSHNDTVMAEGYRMYRDAIAGVDPGARISVSGTQVATPFDGFDWYKLSPLFEAMSGYGYAEQERKRLSFHDGVMKNATPAGYGNKGKGVTYQLWTQLTNHGCGHVLFWWVAFRNPDLTWSTSAVDYQKGFAELRGGIGRQYQLARRHLSPVAIQYSMNSMRACYADGRAGDWTSAVQQMTNALVAAGMDPVFLADEQIAAGELERRGIRVLAMPAALSLGHGAEKGGLDVAGPVARLLDDGGEVIVTEEPTRDEFLQPAELPDSLTGRLVRFEQVQDELTPLLAKAGVTPLVAVNRPDGSAVPGLSVTVHRLAGEAEGYLVTILRRPVGSKEVVGADGVVTYVPDPSGGAAVEECIVDLSGLGLRYATEIRTGRQMPLQDGTLRVQARDGDALALAVLDYQVAAIDLAAQVRGRDVHVKGQLRQPSDEDAARFAPHAVRLEVLDGDGTVDGALSRNLTADKAGAFEVVIPLAEEDAGRTLRLAARDVLSGAETTADPR